MYNSKTKYGGLDLFEAKRLKTVEDVNANWRALKSSLARLFSFAAIEFMIMTASPGYIDESPLACLAPVDDKDLRQILKDLRRDS